MDSFKTLKLLLIWIWLMSCIHNAYSQESMFKRVTVQKTVSIEIPAHWYVRGDAERRDVAAAGEALTGEPVNLAALSVIAPGEKVRGIIRVSITPDKSYSQSEFRAAVQTRQEA